MKQVLIIMMTLLVGFHKPVEEKFSITISGQVTGADDGLPLPQVTVLLKGTRNGVATDLNGKYELEVPNEKSVLVFCYLGYVSQEVQVGKRKVVNIQMQPDATALEQVVVTGVGRRRLFNRRAKTEASPANVQYDMIEDELDLKVLEQDHIQSIYMPNYKSNTESYAEIEENGFNSPFKNPFSTFSIDVDAASYSNVRRFITQGQLPPKDAVKIEEMINYFDYTYNQPTGQHPFHVQHEVGRAPWNRDHYLVHIGIQGQKIEMDQLPPSNIVFLLDVSGSMESKNKLPLLKKSLKLLVHELRPEDRVSIVVYAGAAGEVLPSTSGANKREILKALENLRAGGSTAGGAGIHLAYTIAQENFIKGGNNRIILATDGDFNVGASSDKAMEDLIEEKRKSGVFLTVLGFGMGNYQDSKMEILADKGNGNHAYIDNILEAKKVLVNEFGGTLFTIAKDVKLQVEFNPGTVQAYRLIGYENRLLADEDFNNDKKDAGELGAGHTVTALYEVIPVGVKSSFKPIDDLKYQPNHKPEVAINTTDLMTVKLRYKQPDEDRSVYLDTVIPNEVKPIRGMSHNFNWSAAVASFGMLLRESDYLNGYTYHEALELARLSKGYDENGYRAEMIRLMEAAELMKRSEEE
ncbi:YfbK domain-containing protein [Roseivirga thermotolerans]|nr:von Willebrand factor type A domain-containing protein [Roseivirga thermotolerans]